MIKLGSASYRVGPVFFATLDGDTSRFKVLGLLAGGVLVVLTDRWWDELDPMSDSSVSETLFEAACFNCDTLPFRDEAFRSSCGGIWGWDWE